MTKNKSHIEVEAVLERLMHITEAKNDSELARKIGVTRQVFSTWKKRGTVPYEKLVELACTEDVSLDYLFLGKEGRDFGRDNINPVLLENITNTLIHEIKSSPTLREPTARILGVPGLCAYYAAMIYNRVARHIKPKENWTKLIDDEVRYFVELKKRELEGEIPVPVHPEEKNLLKSLGSSAEEVHGKPIADLNDENAQGHQLGQTHVKQNIAGDGHQIAGRDLINKRKKPK